MSRAQLIFRYSLFSVIAIVINLGSQRLVLMLRDDWAGLMAAIIIGTGTGLVSKYLLDRWWIFYDRLPGARQQGRQFLLYTTTGILTTLLFWGSELAGHLIWQTDFAREVGALLGLITGYVVKYQLDKRFVFNRPGGEVLS